MSSERDWDSDELFEKVVEIEQILPKLELFCAELSSALSGTNVSGQMFRRMGGMWLMHLAHQVAAVRGKAQDSVLPSRIMVPFDAWSHHASYVGSSDYQTLIQALSSTPRKRGDFLALRYESVFVPLARMSSVRRNIEAVLQVANPHSQEVLITRPYLKVGKVQRFSAIARTRGSMRWNDLSLPFTNEVSIDVATRQQFSSGNSEGGLQEMIESVVPHVLPIAYGEGLTKLTTQFRSIIAKPKVLYSANASQFHLPFQLLSASWGEEGTVIASHQHGGHQGLDQVCAGEEYELRASNQHYTLGWTDERQNARPLPTAMPEHTRSRSSQRLLLMSLSSTDVVYRIQPFCMPSHFDKCARETRKFLSQLVWPSNPVLRAGGDDISAMQTPTPVVHEPLIGSGTISASRSALVVHNYLGASWLETLAMNIPTVCFIPTGVHRFRAAAQPFADQLARVGILHYSGSDAAKFVNSFHGDPTSWWKSAEVQEAREHFVARYANFSHDWLPAWRTEFERLLDEGVTR